MKRTAEGVMTIIGIIVNVLMIIGVFLIGALFNDPAMQAEFERELQNDPAMADAGIDPTMITDMFAGLGLYFNVVVIISTILSIIALFAMKRNKKPKLAGGLLIASTLVVAVGTVLLGWLPALLFLIAGIMCFVRKPKVVEDPYQRTDDEMRPL
ncbi:DUF4064 domain-containing protein [Jeotgalibacillus haloalkalitolerans]|uniref:DUF4064 domain-containing protein n=1 Tax=Jeotgalibacillus haloalkalitolerans TaxID=3104292 RepID=A0ABU5KPN1_9BACL|nr:DUF4064 domain-containing protein [Jeotgalibacillus sp. HH7-29]MDZ5713213.1 DUF4064 domain-containing protein [Jeotgalibacillus sp. HH7-29]